MPKKEQVDKTLEQISDLDPDQLTLVGKIIRGSGQRKRKTIYPFSKKHVKIGVVSDCHITSSFTNLKCLNFLYHVFKEEGARFVVNAGDITDGEGMHRGQQNHLRAFGVDRVVEMLANEYPNNGLKTKFIIGNHDYTFYRQNGVDIGRRIAAIRKDMDYVGWHETEMGFEGDILLGPKKKTRLKLLHGSKGSAKYLSYKMQNIVESMGGDEKPNILIVGHYHKMDYLFSRNIHAFQAGTTQNQSEWMRANNLQAHMGGLLLDIYMKDNGTVDRIKFKRIEEGW